MLLLITHTHTSCSLEGQTTSPVLPRLRKPFEKALSMVGGQSSLHHDPPPEDLLALKPSKNPTLSRMRRVDRAA